MRYPQDTRYKDIEQTRQKEKEKDTRNRARAVAKLTAAKIKAEAEAEKEREQQLIEEMGVDAYATMNQKELASAMASLGKLAPVPMGRAPLEGMVQSAPRIDVSDFAAKRQAALAKAKALREQQEGVGVTVSMGSRTPGIGGGSVGGDWGRYERGGVGAPQQSTSPKGVRREPKVARASAKSVERPSRSSPRASGGSRSAVAAKAASRVAQARSILALDPTDKDAKVDYQTALAVLEQETEGPPEDDDDVGEAWGAAEMSGSARKQRRADRRERRANRSQNRERRNSGGSGGSLRAGSQSMPNLPSMAFEDEEAAEAKKENNPQASAVYGSKNNCPQSKSASKQLRSRKRELKAAKKAAAADSAAATAKVKQARQAAADLDAAARLPKPTLTAFASRQELAGIKLSELRKHALERLGMEADACEEALDGDNPKADMVAVVVAHTDAISAEELAAVAAWQEAEDRVEAERRVLMEMEAEAEMAAELAAEAAQETAAQERARQESEVAAERKAATVAAELALKGKREKETGRLRAMKLSELRRHAAEKGLDEE